MNGYYGHSYRAMLGAGSDHAHCAQSNRVELAGEIFDVQVLVRGPGQRCATRASSEPIEQASPTVTGAKSDVRPLAISSLPLGTEWIGEGVEVAGYGLTGSGAPDGLSFAVEMFAEVTPVKLRIDGLGRSGACEGHSGGPRS